MTTALFFSKFSVIMIGIAVVSNFFACNVTFRTYSLLFDLNLSIFSLATSFVGLKSITKLVLVDFSLISTESHVVIS